MNGRLRILLLEDDPGAAETAMLVLREAGFAFDFRLTKNKEEFLAALDDFRSDIVISDYSLPSYDGMSALEAVRAKSSTLPFILLTGSINEETAVDCMKAGATNYVLKEHVKRLPFAVKEALERSKIEEEKEKAEAELRENEERLRHYFDTSPTVTYVLRIRGRETPAEWVSSNITRLLGYSLEEVFEPDWWLLHLDPEDKAAAVVKMEEFFSTGRMIHEYRFLRKDGSGIWIHDDVRLLRDEDGNPREVIGSWTDISERKAAEEKIKASLEEKNALIRELYHRTKNNMQVIIAMLSLQAGQSGDEACMKSAKIMENRILSMSLVQEKLYHLQQLSRIDLREYAGDLVSLLSESFRIMPGDVEFKVEGGSVFISIDAAVPCGLVLNELISNSLQHAFVDGRKGKVSLRVDRDAEGRVVLSFADNGVGLPKGFDAASTRTLGFQLITNSVEYQLRGTIRFAAEGGFSCLIRFSDGIEANPERRENKTA